MGNWFDKAGLTQLKEVLAAKFATKVDRHPGVTAGKFLQTDSHGDAIWGNGASEATIAQETTDWLDAHLSMAKADPATMTVDDSLTVTGAAADAKKVGDELYALGQTVSQKAPIANPAFTGSATLNEDNLATEDYADQAVQDAIDDTAGIGDDDKMFSADGMERKLVRKVNADSAFLYKEASGNPAIIRDALPEAAKRVKIDIEPVQDLHGYDHPWVGGAGKNLLATVRTNETDHNGLDFTWDDTGILTVTGSITSATRYDLYDGNTFHLDPGSYILSGKLSPAPETAIQIRTIKTTAVNPLANLTASDNSITFTVSDENGVDVYPCLYFKGTESLDNYVPLYFAPMLRVATDTDDTYEPYENICPITGWTGCNVSRTGENLCNQDGDDTGNGYVYNRYLDVNGNYATPENLFIITEYVKVKPGTTYSYSGGFSTSLATHCEYDKDKNLIAMHTLKKSDTFVTDANACWMRFSIKKGSTSAYTSGYFMFNEGSTALPYEPFGYSYSVSFPTTAGTVYGGTLTVEQDGTGTLVVDMATRTLDGSENWVQHETISNFYYVPYGDHFVNNSSSSIAICNAFEMVQYSAASVMENGQFSIGKTINNNKRWSFKYTKAADLSEWKAYLSSNPVQVTYLLENSVSYTLTAPEVFTLLSGYNTAWADCGDVTLLYPAEKYVTEEQHDKERIYETVLTPADILTIPDGADSVAIREMTIGIEPQQDLHGYDHPWVGGAGKNLLPITESTTTINGVTFTVNSDGTIIANASSAPSENAIFDCSASVPFKSGSYIISGCPENGSSTTYACAVSGRSSDYGSGGNLTLSEDVNISFRCIVYAGYTPTNLEFKPMIRLTSVSDATWEPYSNICPITGFDHVEVTRTGKNLFDGVLEVGSISNITGLNSLASDRMRSKNYIKLFDGIDVYTSTLFSGWRYYDKNKKYIGTNRTSDAEYVRFVVHPDEGTDINKNISVTFGEETAYEPYSSQTYSISFPSSAGTVYGGTMTVNKDGNGELIIKQKQLVVPDVPAASYNSDNGLFNIIDCFTSDYISSHFDTGIATASSSAFSNKYKHVPRLSIEDSSANGCFAFSGTLKSFFIHDDRFNSETIEAFKQEIAGTVFVIPLNADHYEHYTLSALEVVNLLKGTNNIWASTGQVLSAELPRDTKMYIDKKFTELATLIANS